MNKISAFSHLLLLVFAAFMISCASFQKEGNIVDKEELQDKAKRVKQERKYDQLKRFQSRHDKGGTFW